LGGSSSRTLSMKVATNSPTDRQRANAAPVCLLLI
jgi:hypothetical protein